LLKHCTLWCDFAENCQRKNKLGIRLSNTKIALAGDLSCGHANKPHYVSCPSVRPSLPCGLDLKTKRVIKQNRRERYSGQA